MSGTDEVAARIRALRAEGDGDDVDWPPGPDPRWHGPPPPRPRQPGVAASVASVLGPPFIWVGGSALAAAALKPVQSDTECVGFHCMSPRHGVIFAAVYVGAFVVPVATLISGVVAACVGPERRTGVVTAVLLAYGIAMALLVALVLGETPAADRVGG